MRPYCQLPFLYLLYLSFLNLFYLRCGVEVIRRRINFFPYYTASCNLLFWTVFFFFFWYMVLRGKVDNPKRTQGDIIPSPDANRRWQGNFLFRSCSSMCIVLVNCVSLIGARRTLYFRCKRSRGKFRRNATKILSRKCEVCR